MPKSHRKPKHHRKPSRTLTIEHDPGPSRWRHCTKRLWFALQAAGADTDRESGALLRAAQ